MKNIILLGFISCVSLWGLIIGNALASGNILQFRGVFGTSNYNIVNNVYYTARIGLLTAWGDAGGIAESDLRCSSINYEEEGDASGQLDINIYSVNLDRFLCKFKPSDNIKFGGIGIGLYNLLVYDVTDPSRNDNFYIHYDSNPDFLIADHTDIVGDGTGGYIIDFNNITDTSAAPFTIEHILHHAPFEFVGYFLEQEGDICPVDEIDYIPFNDNPLVISDLNENHQQVCWFVRDLALNEKIEGINISVVEEIITPIGDCEDNLNSKWFNECYSENTTNYNTELDNFFSKSGKNIFTLLYYYIEKIGAQLIIYIFIILSFVSIITFMIKRKNKKGKI